MSHPGIYVRGATTALTRRTTLRKAFLAPWHPLVEQMGLWFLAKAQARTGCAVHASHFVINHHHTDITPCDADSVPRFLRIFHGELSCALNTLLAHERYDAPGEIFDDRNPHRMRLVDAAAQAGHHVYGCLNTMSAGLVDRPGNMPSLALTHRHWRGGPVVVKRPPLYVDPRTNPAELELRVTPPPELYRAFGGDMDALVHHLDRLVEHGRGRIRDARKGRAVVGAKEIRRIHPWSEPRSLRETRGRRVPTYKVGARGLVGRTTNHRAAADTTRFRAEHREVRLRRRAGDAEAEYPFGAYKARVEQRAPMVDEPDADAVVSRPGPTLAEVKKELGEAECTEEGHDEARMALVDEVRAALDDEAATLVEHENLELASRPDGDTASEPGATKVASGVEVRRRTTRRRKGKSAARRIVTLRDRRQGRPKKRDTGPPA